jgi:acetate kinase
MHILVVNCGSSSLKASIVDAVSGQSISAHTVERIGEVVPTHTAAIETALSTLLADGVEIRGVGHRVVHGGEFFSRPTVIDDAVVEQIEALSPLAPLHNPANAQGIRAARAALPHLTHVAVFDTAFHSTLPNRAKHYALPASLAKKHGIRRYGFHGPSHGYVANLAANFLEAKLQDLRVITCHLGNGASVTAVEYGRSVETSMGLTPLEGLVMGTRSGDLDPGALLFLARQEGLDIDGIDQVLNRESGLKGLSGVSNDMRDIEERAANGDSACRMALNVFAHRLRKYIGAYAAVMGGVDAIVFTAGIGENSALLRHRAAQRLDFLGARLDPDANRDARVGPEAPVAEISTRRSRCSLLVVATNEAHAIASGTADILLEKDKVDTQRTIPLAISARHVHLTQEAVEALFGPGHELTVYKDISQPGQFACVEKVDLIGPKRIIEGVRVLGPTRPACQIEISRTDEFHLGMDAPIRNSGDVRNSPGITLQGPAGRLTLTEGVIQARRHIHMHPDDAAYFGVQDRDVVEVEVDGEGRDLIFGDVLVRVKSSYVLEMHLDTDEANAANVMRGHQGLLASTGRDVRLRRKG